ncbi:MAG: hypothetical protein EBU87_09545 [Betaproteobacteria bacterium]|nr:hypothetical protein [Betaproteobacteria bacterium]NCZ47191.1 hypothetical protein [Betaproteobacteria bacterium]
MFVAATTQGMHRSEAFATALAQLLAACLGDACFGSRDRLHADQDPDKRHKDFRCADPGSSQ